jgi:hypothetical protein
MCFGPAVLAISSADRETGCWSWNADGEAAAAVIRDWMSDWG